MQLYQLMAYLLQFFAGVQPGGDQYLIVAAAAGMNFFAQIAELTHQIIFNGGVAVLVLLPDDKLALPV